MYQKLKADIGRAADGTDFAPANNVDVSAHEIDNISSNEADDTSAVNSAYLNGKV